jgi:hypothetical protein
MEARPYCDFCKRYFDPSTGRGQMAHQAVCMRAKTLVALGFRAFGQRLPGDPVIPIKYYRPKPRKKPKPDSKS